MTIIWLNPYKTSIPFGTSDFNTLMSTSKLNLNSKDINLSTGSIVTTQWSGYTSSGSPILNTTGGNNNGSYVSFVGTSSQYFYGTTNLTLNIANGTGFTFIALVKITSASANEQFARIWTGNDASFNFIEIVKNGSTWQFVMNGGSYVNISTPNNTIVQNEWHVVVCRYKNSGKAEVFKNGTSVVETATSVAMNNRTFSNLLYIGKSLNNDPYLSMHLSHLSVFDKALTNQEITNLSNYLLSVSYINNVYLKLKFNTTIIDESVYNNTINLIGTPTINSSIYKFGSGALDLNGSTQMLKTDSNKVFNFGTNIFTCELWIYPRGKGGYRVLNNTNGSFVAGKWSINIIQYSANDNRVEMGAYSPSGTVYVINTTTQIQINTWYHIAFVRDGTFLKVFINGNLEGNYNYSTQSLDNDVNNVLCIGGSGYANEYCNAIIDDIRIIKGEALYTANFTPSSTEI